MPVRFIQLTDTHLFADPSGQLCGLETESALSAVLNQAQSSHWPPDFLLVTGDISQDQSVDSYRRFSERFQGLERHVYCLPGNHDDPETLRMSLSGSVRYERRLEIGGWHLIMLNSAVAGKTGGRLGADQLSFLKEALESLRSTPTLIALHHQPLPVGSTWLDEMIVSNGDEFQALVTKHRQVKVVLFGHVHQEFHLEKDGRVYVGAPSTSLQFKPQSESMKVDSVPPGYRWMTLFEDGRFETGIQRVENYSLSPNLSATGY